MDQLAAEFSDQNVGSVFLYTNEAHPGEHYPHLTSMQQKFLHARDLRDKQGVTRQILVDSLDGACHRAYGSMPNMAWIVNGAGIPVYKSDWTDAHSIRNAILYFLDLSERRESGERVAPFRVERLDYRIRDATAFMKGLELAGPKAVREFKAEFPGGH
ncbi:MAG: hypothetical protein IH944_03330 [Armatimonadetes bacterium]|nr:hypothetical protein [Armatimonadota bacterium]